MYDPVPVLPSAEVTMKMSDVRTAIEQQRDRLTMALAILDGQDPKFLREPARPVPKRAADARQSNGRGGRHRKKCANPECRRGFLGQVNKKYCSRKCLYRGLLLTGPFEHVCPRKACGKKFRSREKDSKYCSMSCRAKDQAR